MNLNQIDRGIREICRNDIEIKIRWMVRPDLESVLKIESESFESSWHGDDFVRCLRQRNCIGKVAEHHNRVVGYMVYEFCKTRLHLLSVAVDPKDRRRGIGTRMVEVLAGKLTSQKRSSLAVKVRERNLAAQQFFRSCGFKAVGILPNNSWDSPDDAYDMQLRYLSTEQRIVRAIERLESLTDTHWELARRNGIGHYEPCDLQSINDGDSDRLILRTREMMKNPKLACKGLNELWNAEAYLDEMSLNGRAQAVVSVESISPVWMNRGKEGQLAHGRSALKAAKKPPGTVPILRSLRSKMGLSPSPMRFFSASY